MCRVAAQAHKVDAGTYDLGVLSPGGLSPRALFVARFGGAMLLLGGLISLTLAVFPVRTGSATQLPVPADTAVVLPAVGMFGLDLVLYGRWTGEDRPGDGALGCDVTTPEGDDVGLKVSTLRALGAGDRRVGDDVLTPLATVQGFDTGWLFTCTGQAADAAQPMYLLGERRPVISRPIIASFGVMCLALGAGGLAVARRGSTAA